jgi:hypothetical protein
VITAGSSRHQRALAAKLAFARPHESIGGRRATVLDLTDVLR